MHVWHIKQSSKVRQAGFITQKVSWLGKQIHTGKNTWTGTCEENAAIHDTRQDDGGGAKTRHYTLPICADRKMIDNRTILTIIVVGEHTRQGQSDVR